MSSAMGARAGPGLLRTAAVLAWFAGLCFGLPCTYGLMTAPPREQTRARYPDESGHVQRDGVRVYYEAYGTGEPTILFLDQADRGRDRVGAADRSARHPARHGRGVDQ